MPAEIYTKAYLKEELPARIKEHLRSGDYDPTHLPTYEFLNSTGFETRGIAKAIQRHFDEDMTLHEFLKKQGFTAKSSDWPSTHQETVKLLNEFRRSRIERNDDRESTVSTMESAMRGNIRISKKLHGIDNLLFYARHDSGAEKYKQREQVEDILDYIYLNKSDGTFENYVRFFRFFYEFCNIRTRIDENPTKAVDFQYNTDRSSNSSPEPLTDEDISLLWETVKQLHEKRTLSEPVENLVTRHGLRRWQIYVMVLLLLGIAVGPRSLEYERTNCQEDWVFGEENFIRFPVRKNLPGEVPILAHPGFLAAYRDYMEETNENWNGKPFPEQSNKRGSITKNTLNNWLAALCEEAGVRQDDGNYPTIQNLRQTWHTEYLKVLRVNDIRLKLTADEAGTKDSDQPKISYRSKEEERRSIRDLITKNFEKLVPLDGLPDEMSKVLAEDGYVDSQKSLYEFNSD